MDQFDNFPGKGNLGRLESVSIVENEKMKSPEENDR
jgi:hypothetical protein